MDERDGHSIGPAEVFTDARGQLTLIDAERVPFTPGRTYVLHELPVGGRRGGHASRSQRRLLVGLSGCAEVTLDREGQESRLPLAAGHTLLIEPLTWHQLEVRAPHTAILVLAEGRFDPGDYVTDRAEAAELASARATAST